MKITFIVTKLNLNGGGENLDIIMKARALMEEGHGVSVVTIFSKSNNLPADLSFRVIEEEAPSFGLLALQNFIVRVLKKYAGETDIYYLLGNSFFFGAGWYRLSSRHSKPVAADINGYADFVEVYYKKQPLYSASYLPWQINLWRKIKHRLRLALEHSFGVFLINRLDAFVFMTETIKRYYLRAGVKNNQIAVMPSFMDTIALQSLPLANNPFLPCPKDIFHIIGVGRFHIDKGIDLLIEAFFGCNCPNAILHLVGDGPERNNLVAMVKKYGLSEKVKFYPWQKVDELVAFYQHAGLFIHPARLPEPMVRTTIEAMSFGLPLVVSNTSRESWLGDIAKIFALGDIDDLRAKIESACADKEFLKSAGVKAKKKALELDYRSYALILSRLLESFFKPTLK